LKATWSVCGAVLTDNGVLDEGVGLCVLIFSFNGANQKVSFDIFWHRELVWHNRIILKEKTPPKKLGRLLNRNASRVEMCPYLEVYTIPSIFDIIGVGRGGRGVRTTPLWKKIFEIDREILLTSIFFKN
jgi:hypothetical protein